MQWAYLHTMIGLSLSLVLFTPVFASEHQATETQTTQNAVEKSAKDPITKTNRSETDTTGSHDEMPQDVHPDESTWMTAIMAKDITGSRVVDDEGDEIGEVVAIVRDIHSGAANAVISVGGFLGIGEKHVAIPLKDLEWHDDRLIARFAGNEQILKSMPAYNKTLYEAVPPSRTVGVGLPLTGTSKTVELQSEASDHSFESLDKDGNGYLSKEEVGNRGRLTDEWSKLDKNKDQRIDQTEFSAFETGQVTD